MQWSYYTGDNSSTIGWLNCNGCLCHVQGTGVCAKRQCVDFLDENFVGCVSGKQGDRLLEGSGIWLSPGQGPRIVCV